MGIFDSIISFFGEIFTFITHIIATMVNMVTFIKGSIEVPLFLLTYMPAIVSSCIAIVCGVAIVKIIVGR